MYVFSIIACHVSHFTNPLLLVFCFEAGLPRPVICLKPSIHPYDGGDIYSLDLLPGSLSAVGIVFTFKVEGWLRLICSTISAFISLWEWGEGIKV